MIVCVPRHVVAFVVVPIRTEYLRISDRLGSASSRLLLFCARNLYLGCFS